MVPRLACLLAAVCCVVLSMSAWGGGGGGGGVGGGGCKLALGSGRTVGRWLSARMGVLFCLILYVPSTIFQLYRDGSSWVEPIFQLYRDGSSWVEPVLSIDSRLSWSSHVSSIAVQQRSFRGVCLPAGSQGHMLQVPCSATARVRVRSVGSFYRVRHVQGWDLEGGGCREEIIVFSLGTASGRCPHCATALWEGWSSGGVDSVRGVSCGVVHRVVSIPAGLRRVSAGLVPGLVGMLASIFVRLPTWVTAVVPSGIRPWNSLPVSPIDAPSL